MRKNSHLFFNPTETFENLSLQEKKKSLQKIQILKQLLFLGEATCGKLADSLSLSYPSTSDLINQLIEENIIKGGDNKRNKLYKLNDQLDLFILTIKISGKKSVCYIQDQFLNLKDEMLLEEDFFQSTDLNKNLISIFEKTVNACKINRVKIIGVSFILPLYSEFKGNFPSPETLMKTENNLETSLMKFISITNHSHCIHRGCYENTKQKLSNALIVNIDKEIGLAIISNGLMRNRKHFPGSEFGHFPIQNNGSLCSCGKKDCLETQISYPSIIEKIRYKLSHGRKSLINSGKISIQTIINSALAGDQLAIEAFYEAGFTFGKAISILIQLIEPKNIIIVSKISKIKIIFSNGVSSGLNLYCPIPKTHKTKISFDNCRSDLLIEGAFYSIWDKVFEKNRLKINSQSD